MVILVLLSFGAGGAHACSDRARGGDDCGGLNPALVLGTYLPDSPLSPTDDDRLLDAPAPVDPSIEPPPLDAILDASRRWFPEEPEHAAAVTFCELGGFANPRAFRLDLPHGGPLQIDRATWERVFLAFGWQWQQVVQDLDTHFAAARFIYEQSGDSWGPWPVCGAH